MLEQEIIKLLKKISRQLEGISSSQDDIKSEILSLRKQLEEFQESTLKDLEEKIPALRAFQNILN